MSTCSSEMVDFEERNGEFSCYRSFGHGRVSRCVGEILGDFGRLWATLDDIEASEMVDFRVWCRRSGRRDAVGGTSGGQVGTIGVKMQDLLSDGDANNCETCNLKKKFSPAARGGFDDGLKFFARLRRAENFKYMLLNS